MDLPLPLATIAALAAVAFVAGAVDAVAGGGGLLSLPALLAAGLPPHLALGTNKGQAIFGTAAALRSFVRGGLVDGARARLTFPLAFLGSAAGAALQLLVRPGALRPLVLGLLVAAALLITFRPQLAPTGDPPGDAGRRAGILALLIGCYDGFFGPGTGTFLILGFALLLHDPLAKASANAKVANLASNLAAVGLFSVRGTILWEVALPMAAAQLAGGAAGAQLARRGGDKLVRWLVLAVVIALCARLAFELFSQG